MRKKISAALAVLIFFYLIFLAFQFSRPKANQAPPLKILSYSSFLAEWGPGKELAELFEKKTGIRVEYQDGEDSGLLLSKLELFPSDLVIGIDSTSVEQARKTHQWRAIGRTKPALRFPDLTFVAFDWSPLTFIYREGEIAPPKNIDDLLDARFKNSISLEDPRTSSPGLEFLYWLIAEKGEDGAFDFLKKLKPNIRAVSPSWSTAYGLFQKKQAKLVFSYLTSPVYHLVKENDRSYKAAQMQNEHIVQVEYAGIPNNCQNFSAADSFLNFLLSEEAQKIIMNKNFMFPVLEITAGTPFQELPEVKLLDNSKVDSLAARKNEFIERWKALEL